MYISYLQFAPSYLNPEGNCRRAGELLDDALENADGADGGVDLIVLPELFTSGYFFKSTQDARAVSEPVPEGPTTSWLMDRAERTGATIVAGLPERSGHAMYNSAVVCSPEGFVGKYRKTHLYYEEKLHFDAGSEGFPVFDLEARDGTPYRLGMMICFDWFFPESARTLALQGADLIAHPSNLVRPNCPRAMPIRALENRVFTVTANRTGQESNGKEELTFIGQSEICDPQGEILERAERAGEAFGGTQIDPHSARDKRVTDHNDLWQDRQPHLYAATDATSTDAPSWKRAAGESTLRSDI